MHTLAIIWGCVLNVFTVVGGFTVCLYLIVGIDHLISRRLKRAKVAKVSSPEAMPLGT